MQLSATANPDSGQWDVAIDGRWLGAGPDGGSVAEFSPGDLSPGASARCVAVWLDNGEQFRFSAVRSKGAKGQDGDAIDVELPEGYTDQVFDPRLSTEYDADGVPRRCGIELWLAEDEDGDQRPLRIGAEAVDDTPPRTDASLVAQPLRAHLNGTFGFAVYVLLSA